MLKEVAFREAPVTPGTADRMLEELEVAAVLRGKPPLSRVASTPHQRRFRPRAVAGDRLSRSAT